MIYSDTQRTRFITHCFYKNKLRREFCQILIGSVYFQPKGIELNSQQGTHGGSFQTLNAYSYRTLYNANV